jgi:hypothetical protein
VAEPAGGLGLAPEAHAQLGGECGSASSRRSTLIATARSIIGSKPS